jgi:hypothetical protein
VVVAVVVGLNNCMIITAGGSFNCHIIIELEVALKHGHLVLALHHFPTQD